MPPPRQTPATAFPLWSRTDNHPQRTPTVVCPLHLFNPLNPTTTWHLHPPVHWNHSGKGWQWLSNCCIQYIVFGPLTNLSTPLEAEQALSWRGFCRWWDIPHPPLALLWSLHSLNSFLGFSLAKPITIGTLQVLSVVVFPFPGHRHDGTFHPHQPQPSLPMPHNVPTRTSLPWIQVQ